MVVAHSSHTWARGKLDCDNAQKHIAKIEPNMASEEKEQLLDAAAAAVREEGSTCGSSFSSMWPSWCRSTTSEDGRPAWSCITTPASRRNGWPCTAT